ncbi:hypothetical protein NKG05_11695 [Oerskovia sp. M15]
MSATIERPTSSARSARAVRAVPHEVTGATTIASLAVRATLPTQMVLGIFRIVMGFYFVWAFLDKTFGLGFSTPRSAPGSTAVAHGRVPRRGAGPVREPLQRDGGAAWADWLFMIGLLGIGLALVLGIGMRIAAIAARSSWASCTWPRCP